MGFLGPLYYHYSYRSTSRGRTRTALQATTVATIMVISDVAAMMSATSGGPIPSSVWKTHRMRAVMAPNNSNMATSERSRPTRPFSINTVASIDLLVWPTDFRMPISRRRSSMASATAFAMMIKPAIIASEASVVSIIIRLLSTWLTKESISTTLRMMALGTDWFRWLRSAGT